MEGVENSIFDDESMISIFESQPNTNLIRIKIAHIKLQVKDVKNSTSDNSKDVKIFSSGYTYIKLPKNTFLNFTLFKQEVLYSLNMLQNKIDRIYYIIEKNKTKEFSSGDEWEDYFCENSAILESDKPLKLEFTIKSPMQLEVEDKLQNRALNLSFEFLSLLKKFAKTNDEFNFELKKFLLNKGVVSNNDNLLYQDEFAEKSIEYIFDIMNSKMKYCKKVNEATETLTTKCSSDVYKSTIPNFDTYIKDNDDLIDSDNKSSLKGSFKISKDLKNVKVYPSIMDMSENAEA